MIKAPEALNRPLARALALTLGWVMVTLATYAAARAALAGDDYRIPALVPIAILSALLAIGLSVFGKWREVGFTVRSEWRETRLFLVPALLVFFPLIRGIHPVDPQILLVLILGYAMTSFAEEALFRGAIVTILRTLGPIPAAALSAILFGAVHLSNILIRGNPAVILAQAIGAACFGFGYAALRLRTNTLVPLVLLHFLTDLFLQLGNLPLIPVAVAQDVVLLALGFVLMSGRQVA